MIASRLVLKNPDGNPPCVSCDSPTQFLGLLHKTRHWVCTSCGSQFATERHDDENNEYDEEDEYEDDGLDCT